jgi:hypothetical protein
METDTHARALVNRSFGVPTKGALLQIGEKHKVTVHGAPCRQKAYIQWGAALFPCLVIHIYTRPQAVFITRPHIGSWYNCSMFICSVRL